MPFKDNGKKEGLYSFGLKVKEKVTTWVESVNLTNTLKPRSRMYFVDSLGAMSEVIMPKLEGLVL